MKLSKNMEAYYDSVATLLSPATVAYGSKEEDGLMRDSCSDIDLHHFWGRRKVLVGSCE